MVSASQTIQHSKWLEEADAPAVAGQGAQPQRPAHLDRVAQRPQRLLPPGPRPDPERASPSAATSARVYLPPDANCLLSVADHCLRSRSYVNLIVIDKQPQLQWLTIDEAIEHCARGAGIWDWAGTDDGSADPDIVLACAGDVVTMETVAAAQILRERLPQLAVRVVNVVDLMTLPRPQGPPARHGRDAASASCSPTTSTSCSPSTATPARSTSWCTAGPTPTGSTSAASSRRAPPRRRSTWSCATGPRATTWSWTRINNASRTPPGASDLKAWCEQQARRARGVRRRAPRGHARGPRLGRSATGPSRADGSIGPNRCRMLVVGGRGTGGFGRLTSIHEPAGRHPRHGSGGGGPRPARQ